MELPAPPRPAASRWCLAALGLAVAAAIVAAGVYVALHFCTIPVFEYYDTLSWAKARGTVVELELVHNHFDCYVTYNFSVAGEPYSGNHTRTIGHHGHFEDHGHAALCVQLNSTRGEGQLEVQYNPRNPWESALQVSFVGDFWLAMHSFDSLALVALGGAVIFWTTKVESAIFALSGVHALHLAAASVPVSAVRISRGHIHAVGPLIFGLFCAILGLICLYQISCCRKATHLGRQKVQESWWLPEENNEMPKHFFVVDDEDAHAPTGKAPIIQNV